MGLKIVEVYLMTICQMSLLKAKWSESQIENSVFQLFFQKTNLSFGHCRILKLFHSVRIINLELENQFSWLDIIVTSSKLTSSQNIRKYDSNHLAPNGLNCRVAVSSNNSLTYYDLKISNV